MKMHEEDMRSEHGIDLADNKAAGLDEVDREAIAILAYLHWEARGCPHDSPHEDWFRAEAELHSRLAASAG